MGGRLLERDGELATLAAAAQRAAAGAGSVVLVSGEAGIGKSSLVALLPSVLPAQARLLVGHCDDLGTPRVLGPLRDLVDRVGPALARALRSADRAQVLEAAPAELASSDVATVLVLEDVHWVDEATLDVVRHLVRRVASLPALVVLTYRDDELAAHQPLRELLGLLSRSPDVVRLRLPRLSLAAVRELSAAAGLDPDRVFGVTSGNPYFVDEVLAAGDADAVPLTIADAVRGRMAALDPRSVEVVEQLAVVPSAVERWLVEEVVPEGFAALAPAELRGILAVLPDRVGFRHELTRRAVVDTMAVARRVEANRRVLAALLGRQAADLSRVVHHAYESGERQTVIDVGPRAAAEAAAAGAHRQARMHLQRVVEQRPELPAPAEADLWQRLAVEGYTIDAPSREVLDAQRRAVALLRGGDRRELGAALRWLSRICWWAGDAVGAASAADEAVAVLSDAGDRDLHARALSNRAQLHALAGRSAEAVAAAGRGLDLDPSPATRSHLLNNLGLALVGTGDTAGFGVLDESLRLALEIDDPEEACRAYTNLSWCELDVYDLVAAERHAAAGVALAERVEFLMFSRYLRLVQGRLMFARGRWDDVVPAAASALEGAPAIRCSALVLVGRLRARRGEPGAADLLREAWGLALAVDETQRIGPAAAALAEAALLGGDPGSVADEVDHATRLAARLGPPALRAELAYWSARLGLPTVAAGIDVTTDGHAYCLLARGDWRAAARWWQAAGLPYEAAAAAAEGEDEEALLEAVGTLDELGADPLARTVRSRLRARGIAPPRRPAAATRNNPAGLTARQLEVALLLVDGLTNAEIAAHLVMSVRTVDSHVAAVLDKLGVRTRRQAAVRAAELGIGPGERG